MNRFIRSTEVTVIDNEGQNLGILPIQEALRLAEERGLDLVEVGPTAKPPITKILDFGKYMYQKEKKERENRGVKNHAQEMKAVQIGFKTGQHDLEIRAQQIDKFLEKGYRVKIDIRLRGRERGMGQIARQKLEAFLHVITQPHTTDGMIKSTPRGFTIQIQSDKKQHGKKTENI